MAPGGFVSSPTYSPEISNTYTVSYSTAYATAPASASVSVLTSSELPELQADGYLFEGWYYDPAFTNKAEVGDSITAATTLYAKWRTATATFDLFTLGLAPGTYSITVKAKADGYADSAESEAVSYEVKDKPAPPTVEATSYDGELNIINDSANGDSVVKYGIYEADGTFVEYVDYTGSPQVVSLDMGTQYYVTAVNADGTESEPSNLATTKQCFVAGTPVLMADGSYKMIEEIAVGDVVQSYNLETSEYCDGEVTEVVTGYTDRIAMVLFADGNYVAMAEGHPLYTEDGWHSITNKDGYPTLVVDDKVLGANGYVEITDIQVVDTEPTLVYSLSVSLGGRAVYFAGAGAALSHV